MAGRPFLAIVGGDQRRVPRDSEPLRAVALQAIAIGNAESDWIDLASV